MKHLGLIIAVLLLGSGQCLNAWHVDQQSMECCTTMPCSPSNQHHSCCKGAVSSAEQYYQAAAKVFVHPPAQAVLATVSNLLLSGPHATVEHTKVDLSRHPPPGDLYTIYHSFLI